MRRYAEHKGGKWATHIPISRQRGKDGNADFLRDVLRDVVTGSNVAEPRRAVLDHHRPDLPDQRFDVGRLAEPAGPAEPGQVRGCRPVTVADSLLSHASPSGITPSRGHDAQVKGLLNHRTGIK